MTRLVLGAGRRTTLAVAWLVIITVCGLTRPAAVAADDTRVAMRGMVVRVDKSRKSIVVSHDSVPGTMAAMTMAFAVGDTKDMDALAPGAMVAFTAAFGAPGPRAGRIRVVPYQNVEQHPLTALRLKLLKALSSPAATPVAPGELVPDFTLTDQTRARVSLSDLRGKVVAVNFIYTSCALPQFCYRIANHFGVLQRRLSHRLGRDLVLLTVTFDPHRDTPERLASYAAQWEADAHSWRFLTGNAAAVERVCSLFGVDFFPDEGLMNHSVHTAVIDRQGRLIANIEGNEFTAAQLGDLVVTALGG